MTSANDPLAEALRQLRLEYLKDAPLRVSELWALLERVERGENRALDELRKALHKLAGSGGSYGFPDISDTSRAGEQEVQRLLASGTVCTSDVDALRALIQEVERAFATASAGGTSAAG